MPKVSVLLTCYNHIAYLPSAVESVLAQSYADWEMIALDDGSTDGSREWLTKEINDPRVRVLLNEENLGTYGTLNRGIESSQGDFIAVLNDDDLWHPDKLAKQVELMESDSTIGLVHTDGNFIDRNGNKTEGEPLGFNFPKADTDATLLGLVYANKIIASAVLVRKKCFSDCGMFDPSYFGSGDWNMWLRVAEKWQVGFVSGPMTMYRVHGENASHKLERIWQDDQMLREWLAKRIPGYADRYSQGELRAAQAHNYACLGTVRTLNGDPSGGRDAYRDSIRLAPRRWKSRLRLMATYLPRNLFRKLL